MKKSVENAQTEDRDLALIMAIAENGPRTWAADIRAQRLTLGALRNFRRRAQLSKDAEIHDRYAEEYGQRAKRDYEKRQSILNVDRAELLDKINSGLNELILDFQTSIGAWPRSSGKDTRFVKWSTDESRNIRTVQFHTTDQLEYGMWFNNFLVIKDNEDPKLYSSITDSGSVLSSLPYPAFTSPLKPATADEVFAINSVLLQVDRTIEWHLSAQTSDAVA